MDWWSVQFEHTNEQYWSVIISSRLFVMVDNLIFNNHRCICSPTNDINGKNGLKMDYRNLSLILRSCFEWIFLHWIYISFSFPPELWDWESLFVWGSQQNLHSHWQLTGRHAVIWTMLWYDRCCYRRLLYIRVSVFSIWIRLIIHLTLFLSNLFANNIL